MNKTFFKIYLKFFRNYYFFDFSKLEFKRNLKIIAFAPSIKTSKRNLSYKHSVITSTSLASITYKTQYFTIYDEFCFAT